MTALALTVPSTSALETSSLPSLSDIAQTATLGTLDTAGRIVQAAEQGVDTAAQIVSVTVPAVTRFVGAFVFPEHLNRILGTVTDVAAGFASNLAAMSAKATVQTMTFGAPAWVETLRQGSGVSAVSGELYHNENSHEFLARCFAGNAGDPLIRDGLLSYLDLRKELGGLQQVPDADQNRVTKISRDIARLEIKLRDYQDFSSFKMILEKGEGFVTEQYKRVNQLSHDTAERIIQRVEAYYQDHCGQLAGKVQGSWSAADTEEKRTVLRSELTQKIAARLQAVFEHELNRDETRVQLDALAGDLHSAFGTYRGAFKASLYTLFGVGYATGALGYLADAAGTALKETAGSALNWLYDGACSMVDSVKDAVSTGISNACSYTYHAAKDFVLETVKGDPVLSTVLKAAETTTQTYHAGAEMVSNSVSAAQSLVDSTTSAVSSGFESLADSVSEMLPATTHDYSSPYWTGSSRILVGYGPDGAPMYGTSCISGFPPEPRISSGSFDLDMFKEIGKPQASLTDLLKPSETPALSPEEASQLIEWLRQK